jgi:hypothetical protein
MTTAHLDERAALSEIGSDLSSLQRSFQIELEQADFRRHSQQ